MVKVNVTDTDPNASQDGNYIPASKAHEGWYLVVVDSAEEVDDTRVDMSFQVVQPEAFVGKTINDRCDWGDGDNFKSFVLERFMNHMIAAGQTTKADWEQAKAGHGDMVLNEAAAVGTLMYIRLGHTKHKDDSTHPGYMNVRASQHISDPPKSLVGNTPIKTVAPPANTVAATKAAAAALPNGSTDDGDDWANY